MSSSKDTADSTAVNKALTALDEYVTLGKSGLRISPVTLGAMTFGEAGGFGANLEDSRKVFDYYYENGGNFVDTANIYTGGDSERFLGDFISDKRSDIVLASKYTTSPHLVEVVAGLPPRKLNFIGLQTKYSLIDRSFEYDLLPVTSHLGLGTVPWGILESGFLTGKYSRSDFEGGSGQTTLRKSLAAGAAANAQAWDILDEVKAVAQEVGRTPAQVATNWTLQRPGVTSILAGTRTVDQLKQNLEALEFTLTPEQIARLDKVSEPSHAQIPFSTRFVQNGGWSTYIQPGKSKPAPEFRHTLGF
ncbi:Aldo/keto reductase [Martensiomyces pterosporus]|nr:Aldo/keto reductase [Martensiomyces pterosporus]